MTLGQPLSQEVPAPRSDPNELLLRLIETYDVIEWPVAANMLARSYRALADDHSVEEAALETTKRLVAAERRIDEMRTRLRELDRLRTEVAWLRPMSDRLDEVIRGRRFPTWIGKRIAYWIKHGSLGWPYS